MWNCTSLSTTTQGKNYHATSSSHHQKQEEDDDDSRTTLGENDEDEGSLDLLAPRRIKKAKYSTAENSSPIITTTTQTTTKKLFSPASQTLNMLNAFNTTCVNDLFVSDKELLKSRLDRNKPPTNNLGKPLEATTTSTSSSTTTIPCTTTTDTVAVENLSTFFRNSSNVKAGIHVGCQRCLELSTKGSSNISHGMQCPSHRSNSSSSSSSSSQRFDIIQDTTTTTTNSSPQLEKSIMNMEPPIATMTRGASSSSSFLEDHSVKENDEDNPKRDCISIGTNIIQKGPVVDPNLSHSCSQQVQNPIRHRSEVSTTAKEPRTMYYNQQGSHDSRVLVPRERFSLPLYPNDYTPRMVAPLPGDTIYQDKDEESSRWVPCGNPWGPHGYVEGDVVIAFGGDNDNERSYYYYPPRFCHDPFEMSSTYRKTHCGGLDNYTVLTLRRDAFALQFWGFTTIIHEFGGACLVQHITPCSPADAAVDVGNSHIDEKHPFVGGLRVNDLILCINGKAVGGMSEVEFLTEMDLSGPTMLLVVARCFDTNLQMSSARSIREVDESYWAFNEPLHWTEFGRNTIPQSQNLDQSYTHWDNNGRRQHHSDTNNLSKLSSTQSHNRASDIDRANTVKDSRVDKRVVANSKGGVWPRQNSDKEDSNKDSNRLDVNNRFVDYHPGNPGTDKAIHKVNTQKIGQAKRREMSQSETIHELKSSTNVSTTIRSKITEPDAQMTRQKHVTSDVGSKNTDLYQDYVKGRTVKDIESRRQLAKDWGLPENWLAYRSQANNYYICNPEGVRFPSKKAALESLNQRPLKKRLLPTEYEPEEETITISSGVSIQNNNNADKVCLVDAHDSMDLSLNTEAEPLMLSCTCGKTHFETKSVFWIQCDKCDIWYNVSPRCVGFDHDQAIHLDRWFCLECGRNSSVQPRSDNSLNVASSQNSSVVGSQSTPLEKRVVANSKGVFWPKKYVDKENSNKELPSTTEAISVAIRSNATVPSTQVTQRNQGTSEVERRNAASYQDYVKGLTSTEIESRRQFARELGLPKNWLAYRNHVYNYFICNPEGVRFSSKKAALDSLNQLPFEKRMLPTEYGPGEESITICSGVSIENSQNSSVGGCQNITSEKNKRTFSVGELVIVTYNLTGEVGRVTHVYKDPETGEVYYDIAYLLGRSEKNVEAEWLTPHESSSYDCSRTRGRSKTLTCS